MSGSKQLLYALPGVRQLEQSRAVEKLRYWHALHFENRRSFTYTQFYRLPTQYAALTGPVLEFLGGEQRRDPLRIVVVASSMGAEAYTIASLLKQQHPALPFEIEAFDIDAAVIEVARSGAFDPDWVTRKEHVTDEFVNATFDRVDGRFVVKPDIARHVRFAVGDILDAEAVRRTAPADVVYAQNMMCNMQRPMARRAFTNIGLLLAPRSALFVDGVDLDMRAKMTQSLGLEPLDWQVERIHEEACQVRGPRYPWFATGLEPFEAGRRDRTRRYATIFLRG